MNYVNEKEIIFYFHDLRNKMSQAKSCIYVAMDDEETLKENEWLTLCSDAIDRSTQLLDDGLKSFDLNPNTTCAPDDYVRVEVQEFIQHSIKEPINDPENKGDIEVKISFQLFSTPKYMLIDPK
ncbi:hypothetical protein MJH12_15935, partial [bacterium]|nr:hypothetical protein [bacterium]